MNDELLSCPFCGSGLVEPTDDGAFAWVYCTTCGAEGPTTNLNIDPKHNDATRLWNRRPSSIDIEGIAEQIMVAITDEDGFAGYPRENGGAAEVIAILRRSLTHEEKS